MLKNQDLAHQLLTMTETLIEASELLYQYPTSALWATGYRFSHAAESRGSPTH